MSEPYPTDALEQQAAQCTMEWATARIASLEEENQDLRNALESESRATIGILNDLGATECEKLGTLARRIKAERDEAIDDRLAAESVANSWEELAEKLKAENAKLLNDIQFMVKKAAETEPTLDGYRELGAQTAQALAERDKWQRLCREAVEFAELAPSGRIRKRAKAWLTETKEVLK